MGLIASVSSCKGGSGKSTTSMNLGVSLAKLGRDVTIVDTNLSTPYLSMYLGVPNLPITLHHVLQGSAKIHEAVYQHESGAKIIPGSLSMKDFENLRLEDLRHYLPHLRSDITILDGAPGLDREAQASMKLADEVLVVTTPELPSVAQSLKTIRFAQRHNKKLSGVVLTRAGHNLDLKIKNIQAILEHPIIGVIPEDPYIKRALVKREPVVHIFPNAPSSIAYRKLAMFLTGVHDQENTDVAPAYKFMRWAFGVKS